MIKEAIGNRVTFCELVDHPGGHDGGSFPQDHTYWLMDDGGVVYDAVLPQAPNNDFGDENPQDYSEVSTAVAYNDRDKAVRLLKSRLFLAEKAVETTRELLRRLENGSPFEVDVEVEEEEEGD